MTYTTGNQLQGPQLRVRVSVGVILAIILGVILGYTWVILGLYLV